MALIDMESSVSVLMSEIRMYKPGVDRVPASPPHRGSEIPDLPFVVLVNQAVFDNYFGA